jgi:hypothetical protein
MRRLFAVLFVIAAGTLALLPAPAHGWGIETRGVTIWGGAPYVPAAAYGGVVGVGGYPVAGAVVGGSYGGCCGGGGLTVGLVAQPAPVVYQQPAVYAAAPPPVVYQQSLPVPTVQAVTVQANGCCGGGTAGMLAAPQPVYAAAVGGPGCIPQSSASVMVGTSLARSASLLGGGNPYAGSLSLDDQPMSNQELTAHMKSLTGCVEALAKTAARHERMLAPPQPASKPE